MALNMGAYTDCYEIFDRALDNKYGIRIGPNPQPVAEQLRFRLHYSRVAFRDHSTKIYQKDDPKYNQSPYDKLICRVLDDEDGGWWVYVHERMVPVKQIEELTAADLGIEEEVHGT